RHLDAVLRLAIAESASAHLDLPGLAIERRGDRLVIHVAARTATAGSDRGGQFEYALPCPGEVAVAEAGVTVLASVGSSDSDGLDKGRDCVRVRQASFAKPFSVRNRRDGDRFRPLGSPGRRKLQDVLVDRKVPRED